MWRGIMLGFIASLAIQSVWAKQESFDESTYDLRKVIPGEPDVDYPIYSSIPETSFTCIERHEGYYADIETRCQTFRICANTDFSEKGFAFLCPNGTVFNQKHFICDWYTNVNCEKSEDFYHKNYENGKLSEGQMMKKAQMMVEFPKKTFLRAANEPIHITAAPSTTLIHNIRSTRTPIIVTPSYTFENNFEQSIKKQTRPTKPVSLSSTESTKEIFVSSLGELSSDANSSFSPMKSVILDLQPASNFLNAPLIDFSSLAQNINSLADDVEAESSHVNVRSVESPVVDNGKEFALETFEEPLTHNESSASTSYPIIESINEISAPNIEEKTQKTTYILMLPEIQTTNVATESSTTTTLDIINLTEAITTTTIESTTATTNAPTTTSVSTTTSSTTTETPATLKPTRILFPKVKINRNRVSNFKRKNIKSLTTKTPGKGEKIERKREELSLKEKSDANSITTEKTFKAFPKRIRPIRIPYRSNRTLTTQSSSPLTSTTNRPLRNKTSISGRKSQMKNMKFYRRIPSSPLSTTKSNSSKSLSSTSKTIISSTTLPNTTTPEPTTTSKYLSFDQLKQSIVDDSILQKYKEDQKDQLRLNPTTTSSSSYPSSAVQPFETRYVSQSSQPQFEYVSNAQVDRYTTSAKSSQPQFQSATYPQVDRFITSAQSSQPQFQSISNAQVDRLITYAQSSQPQFHSSSDPQFAKYSQTFDPKALSYMGKSSQSLYPQPPLSLDLPRSHAVNFPKLNQVDIYNSKYLTLKDISQSSQKSLIRHQRNTNYFYHQPQLKPKLNYNSVPPQSRRQYKQQSQTTKQTSQFKPQSQPMYKHASTVQANIPLFPPLVNLEDSPQPQAAKQNFKTYRQFTFKSIPVIQRRLALANFNEDIPNFSLFHGVSSYDVPLSSIGVLRMIKSSRF